MVLMFMRPPTDESFRNDHPMALRCRVRASSTTSFASISLCPLTRKNRLYKVGTSELATHVQNLVPKLGVELGSPARGFVVVGPASSGTAATSQTARFGSRGEDFIVARRLR
jgi:hypothetical protein